ncbi:glucosaminidase domain-containing protein [Streptococcus sp. BJSWXB6CM1]|uniref:Glucosaminidase domain-containing protein n=2 Tax=Streptococcus TaxID=1301 RepID=A0ABU5FWB7_9STRE|nr:MULTISPECIES: glucosaminidase domain-containing protein [unclassified Streptococcus]MDY4345625.1 glucosaminidase domain-containing protein [Streptococcus sp. BJSWXB5TM5]MDY4360717.1 glucosaminidase domain-containing protein [Streptococcus sp. BJSWXB3CM3]MDY4370850.1 glucosaminidase domain-containing protein [Streptococcus sp. BJSWXB6CM1]
MKKILLASTVALSMAGFAKTTVYAEDSQATNNVQSSEKIATNTVSNEKKNQSEAEKVSSQTPETKEQPSKETVVEVVNKEGWQKENNQWRYYEDNQSVSNWKKIAGVWYYFNQDGIMLSNTIFNDYLLNNSGALTESSWVKIDNQWYYATEDGKVTRNNWKKIAGVWYRFDENGIMISNAVYDDYLFKASGVLAENSWVKIGDKWYYGNQEGKINRDKWAKIDGLWYRFDESGVMLSATIYKDYLLKTSGAMAENAWAKLEDKWYYATASGKIIRDKWEKISGSWYYFNKDGVMLSSQWKEKYYLKDSGAMAKSEWIFDEKYKSWFYLKSDGTYAENQWVGSYYLKSFGYMAKNEWIFDKDYNAWYYLKEDGAYVTGNFTINGKDYTFQSNGKWISDTAAYYKVKPITANVYSASGEKLSYISQGSIVAIDGAEAKNGRLPVKISGLSGYMNKSDLVAVSSDSDFIPHYATDGNYLYHELSPYASIRVAPHSSSMAIGKKYYSADGKNFENFTVENPFLFRDLRKPTNYTAEELDKVYSLMNIKGSRLAGKGAIFKEAEERYQINALYLIAHSAIESSWGRSQIAKDKNNFFGIAAYDTTPYDSAKSFDDVDKGILGAAKWIRENYIDNGRTYLGNKASGMNVLYASDPYWGEKIASIMMRINSQLGEKD